MNRHCKECGASLEAKRVDAIYCSAACRTDYHNREKRIARLKARLVIIQDEIDKLERPDNDLSSVFTERIK